MESIFASLTVLVAVLLTVGFTAAIMSLVNKNQFDTFGTMRRPKGDKVGAQYWGQYLGEVPKPATAAPSNVVKLPDQKRPQS